MLDIPSGTLGFAAGFLHCKSYVLRERNHLAGGIGLHVIDEQVQCVRHTLPVIDPNLEAVLLDIELCDKAVRRNSLDPQRIYLGRRSHECYVRRPWLCAYLIDNHLLGRLFAEHYHLIFRLSGLTVQGVLHIVFHEFREVVSGYDSGTYYAVVECNAVIVRVIDVVGTFIPDCVQAIVGIRDISQRKESPVISLDSGVRSVLEDCGIGQVLVKHYCSAFYGLQGIAVSHDSGNRHGINLGTCREHQRVARIHVALVVVRYRIGKVQGVCRVRVEV